MLGDWPLSISLRSSKLISFQQLLIDPVGIKEFEANAKLDEYLVNNQDKHTVETTLKIPKKKIEKTMSEECQ